jgi:hypothetical protein
MVPLMFASTAGNNKYYSGQIQAGGFAAGTVVQYYLRIAYDDHATTFLQADAGGISSVTTGDEAAAQAAPFSFTIDTPDKRGQWEKTFPCVTSVFTVMCCRTAWYSCGAGATVPGNPSTPIRPARWSPGYRPRRRRSAPRSCGIRRPAA